MNLDIKKEVSIEYIENTYALASNFIMKKNNLELKYLLDELELMEDKIRNSNDVNKQKKYKNLLLPIINKIEVIVNE